MFSEPFCGWSQLTLGDFDFPCSYLTHPVLDCIEIFKKLLQTNRYPGVLKVDGESMGDAYIVFDDYYQYCIYHNELIVIEKDIEDIIKDFIDSVEPYYLQWTVWDCFGDDKPIEFKEDLDLLKRYLTMKRNDIVQEYCKNFLKK